MSDLWVATGGAGTAVALAAGTNAPWYAYVALSGVSACALITLATLKYRLAMRAMQTHPDPEAVRVIDVVYNGGSDETPVKPADARGRPLAGRAATESVTPGPRPSQLR
jgi:hypothetical protein